MGTVRQGRVAVHEFSLAVEICRLAVTTAGTENAGAVRTVGVEVGAAADVAVENLEFCLEVMLANPPFGAATPKLLTVPGSDLRLAWLEIEDGD